jgi:hypothetical protein
MARLTKLIMNTPPSGFRWQVSGGGKALKSGTTKTEAEANAAADAAIKELEAADKGEGR